MGNPTAGRVELTPAELDRLEDALEDLEFTDFEADPDDAVATRLHEFRDLLALSREAMPMEDVPAGLLDGVIEEARRAAVTVPAAAAQPSWWERLRASWIPALAFAGSAAALLLVLWPKAEDDSAAVEATVAQAKPAEQPAKVAREADGRMDERLADASLEAKLEDGQRLDPLAGEGLAIGQRGIGIDTPAAAAPADEDALAPAAEPEPELDPAWEYGGEEQGRTVAKAPQKKSRGSSSGYGNGIGEPKPGAGVLPGSSAGKGGGAPPAPAPKSKPEPPAEEDDADDEKKKEDKDVDPVWTEVIEGDRLRHAGNCGLAKMRYDKARKSDVARTRARGLAGRGLCEALAGNATSASKLFEQARASDPSVGAFIDAELGGLDGAPSGRPPNANESPDLMFEDDAVKE